MKHRQTRGRGVSRAAAEPDTVSRRAPLRTAAAVSGPGIIQACRATTKDYTPIFDKPKSKVLNARAEMGAVLKRTSPSMSYGYYPVVVLSGAKEGKTGYMLASVYNELPKSKWPPDPAPVNRGKEEEEVPVPDAPKSIPNAFSFLSGRPKLGENDPAIKAGIPHSWVSDVLPSSVTGPHGGSAAFFNFENISGFETPPGTPSHDESAYRQEIPESDFNPEEYLILNFGEGGLNQYGSEYKQFNLWTDKKEPDVYGLNKSDRRDARGSSAVFNAATSLSDTGELKATPLTEEEKDAKKEYTRKVRSAKKLEGKGGAILHGPDVQFEKKTSDSRKKGGSALGAQHGTINANSLTGQVLHGSHPQNKKARRGVKGMLIRENNGKIYKYTPTGEGNKRKLSKDEDLGEKKGPPKKQQKLSGEKEEDVPVTTTYVSGEKEQREEEAVPTGWEYLEQMSDDELAGFLATNEFES
jgi:hypothetical protein